MTANVESPEAGCKVSICVPTYNGSRYLRQAIESARAQTFRDFELLIVDDDSTDETIAIAEEFARVDSRVRLYRNPRRLGLGGNWNRCLELASGEWIKFLFQDDYLAPACAERLYQLGMDSGAMLVACRRRFEFDKSVSEEFKRSFLAHAAENDLKRRFPNHAGSIPAPEFAAHAALYPALNCIGEPTATMFRRKAVAEFGNFNADLMQAIDWEYWLRITVARGLAYLDESLATFRLHDGGATFANLRRPTVLDLIIIYHELAYKPYYAAVREEARDWGVDLRQKLFNLCRSARPGPAGSGGDQPTSTMSTVSTVSSEEWNRLVKSYPRLRFPQLNYLMLRSVDKLKTQLKPRTLRPR